MNIETSRTAVFDQAKAEAFADDLGAILNGGAVCTMLSVGHRLGLLDTLAGLRPSTSAAIADAAGLHERYVREWLAVLVTARIVIFDPVANTYELPPEHAAALTRDAALGNLAVYAQMVVMAGKVEEHLMDAFRSGEGIPYEAFPCFHHIMAEDSGQTVVAAVDEIVATLAPDIAARLEQGINVMDAGCGAGLAAIRLAELYPASRVVGVDFSEEAIGMATREAARREVANVRFEARDLTDFSARGDFDLITSFDAIHDTRDPGRLLKAIHTALRSGGVHLMQDIGGSAHLENNLDFPFASFLYMISCTHCTPVSLAQGGAGLGTMWGWETAERMLGEAGYTDISRTVLPHDPMNVWFVSRKA